MGAGAAASLFPPGLFAQSGGGLAGLPRRALVIGNNRYRDSPLKNPINDAKAITTELEATDFSVNVLLDASLEAMRSKVEEFGREIARSKAIGLFYFAGHGIQLSWRNYLLPVDTSIGNVDEVRERAIDLGRLLELMGKAGNPANLVILDACRNNPFGRDFRVEQRGLSQVDAPVGTLLAYATAPGNVAIDGEGENGLYTEHLLREMRVPDAKVEDIFKRVRLGVRRNSKGMQIPWESTSLEDDFYFQLPEEFRRAAEESRRKRQEAERAARQREEELQRQAEAERQARGRADAELQRKQEAEREARLRAEAERQRREAEVLTEQRRADAERLRRLEAEREARRRDESEKRRLAEEQQAMWEQIKDAREAKPLEDYLFRYPSGMHADLVQLRLDQRLAQQGERRIEIAASVGNPYTKGTARADTAFKVGDTFTYRVADLYTKVVSRELVMAVTAITANEVVYDGGAQIADLLGNPVKTLDGRRFSGFQAQPLEYTVGRKWSTRFKVQLPNGNESDSEIDYKVVDRERITVPAGTFDCYRVEGHGGAYGFPLRIRNYYWMAPGACRRALAAEFFREAGRGRVVQSDRWELASFRQS